MQPSTCPRWNVYELREKKIVRATLAYPDKKSGLEAVGVSE